MLGRQPEQVMVVYNEDSIDKEGRICTVMAVEVGGAKALVKWPPGTTVTVLPSLTSHVRMASEMHI